MRTVVPALWPSIVERINPAAPLLAAVLMVIEVTAKPRWKPELAAVVKIGAARTTTLSLRISTPVTTPVAVPERIVGRYGLQRLRRKNARRRRSPVRGHLAGARLHER
jgi:hypothetical protein